MIKILYANFFRLKKNIFFWIAMAFMSVTGIAFPLSQYTDMTKYGNINNIDKAFFGCALFIGVIAAAFCSLYIGTEYGDGTIRNKIVVGQRRTAIYLSNLITASIAGMLMCVAFFIPYLCIGIPLLGFFTAETGTIIFTVLTVFFLAIAFSSIFTLIAMLCQNKAITAVVCILFAFTFLIVGSVLNSMLIAPEKIPIYTMNGDGGQTASEKINPKYLDGTKRDIVQFLYDATPGGQAIQCSSLQFVNLPILPVYSAMIVIFTTGTGILIFRKKDIK